MRVVVNTKSACQKARVHWLLASLVYCGFNVTLNKYIFFIPEFELDFDCMSLSSEYEVEFEFATKRTSRNGVFPGGHPSKYQPRQTGLNFGGRVPGNEYVLFLTFLLLVSYPSVCMSVWLIRQRFLIFFRNSSSATA